MEPYKRHLKDKVSELEMDEGGDLIFVRVEHSRRGGLFFNDISFV